MKKLNKIRTVVPAFGKALFNKNTPTGARLAVIAALAYAIMPADMITDLVPVLGWMDDALVMTILVAIASKLIPDYIMEKEKQEIIDDVDYEVIEG